MACGSDRQAPPPPSASDESATRLVTEAERRGEAIFARENCGRCHTLFDRPRSDGAIELPPGPANELLGSRVGPDLGLEGHFRADEWQLAHLYAPGALVPGSRMPASRHLFRPENGRPSPTAEARDLVAYLQALGRARRDLWAEWRSRDQEIPSPPRVDADLAGRGDELYRRHCASCHGPDGDGRGEAAPFFSLPPRNFVAGRYRFKSTPTGRPPEDADLYRSITLGTGTGAAMPAFYWLGEIDRWSLVLRVKEFSPALRGTGLIAPGKVAPRDFQRGRLQERVEEGRRVWNDLGCASCHGPSGSGMMREEAGAEWTDGAGVIVPRSGDLTHACALRGGASESAIERALTFGVGEAMPVYADALTDASKRRALISFLLSLQNDRTEPERPTSQRTPGRR